MNTATMNDQPVKVGIIGCGEVTQVIHIPTLNYMLEYFTITYLCDVSPGALDYCAKRVVNHVPAKTRDAAELCQAPDVDVVFVVNSDEFHVKHALIALWNNKHCFIEKPMAMTEEGANMIIEAESRSRGRVMVGYMRRYAAAFVHAVKEIGGLDKVVYARIRGRSQWLKVSFEEAEAITDIIGPNSVFVGQSATFPKHFTDVPENDIREKEDIARQIAMQGLNRECGVEVTPELIKQYRVLGNLGSHDLSAMREALGMPEKVLGVSIGPPFWSVLFQYPGFTVTYESGLHNIPIFDAHVEVYGHNKSVRVDYDTPYVKGLPITMLVRENIDGALHDTTIRDTYEDAYTLEMKQLYGMIVHGQAIKTTAHDAKEDLAIYRMIIRAAAGLNSQC